MSLPTTFAHKTVLHLAEVRAIASLEPACACELRIAEDVPAAELAGHRLDLIKACEPLLLDAMGRQTFSSFVCVTFDERDGVIRVKAWKVAARQDRQAA